MAVLYLTIDCSIANCWQMSHLSCLGLLTYCSTILQNGAVLNVRNASATLIAKDTQVSAK